MPALFLRELGSGPAVLLLGGAPTPAEHLVPLARRLATRYRVFLPDLPGYGQSCTLEGPYSLTRTQALIEDALLERGMSDVAVVGLSLGAYRAFALALAGRLRVTTLVSLGGFAGLDHEAAGAVRAFAAALREGVDLGAAFVARMLSPSFAKEHPKVAAEVRQWPSLLPRQQLADELTAVAGAPDLRPRLAELDMPIVTRVGRLDLASPPRLSEAIGEACIQAELQIVEERGHLLLLEDRSKTIAAVEQALRDAYGDPMT